MAKATGYFCDNCKQFETTEDSQAPIGWLRLTVRIERHDPHAGFDLCSNKCAAQFTRERARAEKDDKKPARKKNDEDGLTSVAGHVDKHLRTDKGARNQPWWETYAGGYEQATGRGYSWIVDFGDDEKAAFVRYLQSTVTVIKHHVAKEERAQTNAEKNLLAACNSLVQALSEAA